MRAITCLLVTALVLVVAEFRTSDVSASSNDRERAATCAFDRSGRKIGCLEDASDCSILYHWRRGSWAYMQQVYGEKDIEPRKQDVAGKLVKPGQWQIIRWSDRRQLGWIVATNHDRTRWRITDFRGRFVASARGRDAPEIAMVMLYYGRDVFC
jgi:hypothetical protein